MWNTILVIIGIFGLWMLMHHLTQGVPMLQLLVLTAIGLASFKLIIDNGRKYDVMKPLRERGIVHPFHQDRYARFLREQATGSAPKSPVTGDDDWGDDLEDADGPSPFELADSTDEDEEDEFWDDPDGDEPHPWINPDRDWQP